jgi:hypothetical protein
MLNPGKNAEKAPNSHPELFFGPDQDGLGAFVVLDYTLDPNHPRFEHAIVVIPHWNSMHALLTSPGFFMEQWRKRYLKTPPLVPTDTNPATWDFESPITIVIEPLNTPTAANLMFLEALAPLYPGFGGIASKLLNVPKEVRPLSLKQFESAVKIAAAGPVMNSNWGSSGASQPFPLRYIAEFALMTRTLTLRYLPPDQSDLTDILFDRPEDKITAITENKVQGTNLSFLHFDLVLPGEVVYSEMMDIRARFAINFLANTTFLNNVTIVTNPTNLTTFLDTHTHFQASSKTQSLTASVPVAHSSPRPNCISWGPRSLILDSIPPAPSDGDPVPPPCVLVPTIPTSSGYPITTGTIKAYEPVP